MFRSTHAAALGLVLACAGCATHTGTGTLIGSGFGAATGAIIGSATGNAGTGALIGAGTGALVGGLAGQADDVAEQRDAARFHAAQLERQAIAQRQPPMTNADLVMMAQGGLSAEVISEAVRSRGGRFALSPSGLVALKQSGVGDDVIVSVQRLSQSAPETSFVSHVEPPPTIVEVPPPPVGVVVVAPHPRRCRPPCRRGPHFSVGFEKHW